MIPYSLITNAGSKPAFIFSLCLFVRVGFFLFCFFWFGFFFWFFFLLSTLNQIHICRSIPLNKKKKIKETELQNNPTDTKESRKYISEKNCNKISILYNHDYNSTVKVGLLTRGV